MKYVIAKTTNIISWYRDKDLIFDCVINIYNNFCSIRYFPTQTKYFYSMKDANLFLSKYIDSYRLYKYFYIIMTAEEAIKYEKELSLNGI